MLVTLTHAGRLSRDKLSEQDAKVSTLLPGMDTESQLLYAKDAARTHPEGKYSKECSFSCSSLLPVLNLQPVSAFRQQHNRIIAEDTN